MNLTRRGQALFLVVVLALVSGTLYGARSLGAIVAPGAIGLATGALQLYRTDPPTFERHLPDRGQVGDTVTVEIELRRVGVISGHMWDKLDPGLESLDNRRSVTITDGTVSYDVELASRGRQGIGPLEITVTDVLGLVEDTHHHHERDHVVVWPAIYPLRTRWDVLAVEEGTLGPERGPFDFLREYQPGDPVQDIHWKSSAKTPAETPLVMEFVSEEDEGPEEIRIRVDATNDTADEVASTAASLVEYFLSLGFEVGLLTARDAIDADRSGGHRSRLLDALAQFEPGPARTSVGSDWDLRVRGRKRVTVETDEESVPVGSVLAAEPKAGTETVATGSIEG